MKVSIVIPALNEGDVIESTLRDIPVDELVGMGFDAEVVVVDNGSVDDTAKLARAAGARVVREERVGYGHAYLRGFHESKGDVIVMVDADGTYPLKDIPHFLEKIENGADFVIGSRLRGRVHDSAMPWLHRYVGNPILTGVLNLLFKTGISDAHCGMRAFTREALGRMNLKTDGMEFASEMVIEASRKNLKIEEVPIDYFPRRGGVAKLRSFEDGWRHLRFMALYRPIPFLFVPGVFLFILGLALLSTLLLQGLEQRMHSLILAGFLSVIGFQVLSTGLYFKVYGVVHGLGSRSGWTGRFLDYHSLEMELLSGLLLFLAGLFLGLGILYGWVSSGFGSLSEVGAAVVSLVLASLGLQVIFLALFVSVLLLNWDSGGMRE